MIASEEEMVKIINDCWRHESSHNHTRCKFCCEIKPEDRRKKVYCSIECQNKSYAESNRIEDLKITRSEKKLLLLELVTKSRLFEKNEAQSSYHNIS